jgi:peptide/nickel transport system permease protein
MAEVWLSNLAVLALVAGGVLLGMRLRRDELWSGVARQLWRRRPLALLALAACVLIALLDSVRWVGGASVVGQDAVAVFEARSLIDRALDPGALREKSYSAPLADTEFYGGAPLSRPGAHLLGTDVLGRDVLHLTLKGFRVALMIGGFTSLLAIPLALVLGVSAGYFGGRIDDAVFFLISTLASIPSLLLLIALVMALGRGTVQVCVALGVTSWVSFCRVARAETFKLRELDYVQAARVLGVSDVRIIVQHVLPNLAHLIVITFVLLFSSLVLAETVLSYLGVGVDGSWGQMIDQARSELSREPLIWWNLAAASSALFALLLTVNVLGDALRDILDPRTVRELA